MERNILVLIFKNAADEMVRIKINDVRTDLTSLEVKAVADKILAKDALTGKKKKLVEYMGSELEKTTIEKL
ncbi:MAG: DUF2922 domain-containing protein [Oscillospiraceae bacterium]|nr:DUF2922 domain-containing protein [Oscillospiraceae bacterium]